MTRDTHREEDVADLDLSRTCLLVGRLKGTHAIDANEERDNVYVVEKNDKYHRKAMTMSV